MLMAPVSAQPVPVTNPFSLLQPERAPAEILVVVEIPAGSFIKYEIGDDGLAHVDRFLSMPMGYPANYGGLSGTLAGDGDPLDALVFTRVPLHPGVLIRARPIGVLRMVDGGDPDEKIIAVPVDEVDPTYAGIRSLADLPAIERQRIEAFFRVYKQLPDGGKPIGLDGFGDVQEAQDLIGEAVERYLAGRRPAAD